MNDYNETLLRRRFSDLSQRASAGGYYVYSDFLSPAEQALLSALHREGSVSAYEAEGGYAYAERRVIAFGSQEELGYAPRFPACWLRISPLSKKFAETLTHRDYLGSLIGLGIERDVLGDILLHDGEAYLFALESIAPYLTEHLSKVRHTNVSVTPVEKPPVQSVALPDAAEFVVAAERLDALVAAVYKLSRSEAARLFEKGLVSLDGRVIEKPSAFLHSGSMVSVRGYGRFLYEGVVGDTRKGRLRIRARVYG